MAHSDIVQDQYGRDDLISFFLNFLGGLVSLFEAEPEEEEEEENASVSTISTISTLTTRKAYQTTISEPDTLPQ